MCGIAGYIGKKNLKHTKEKSQVLKKFMKFRGPDGYGTFQKKISKIFILNFFILDYLLLIQRLDQINPS